MPPLLAGENFEIRYINVGLSWLQRTRRNMYSHSPSTACTRRRRRLLLSSAATLYKKLYPHYYIFLPLGHNAK